jgi:hypothetical protein
MFPGENITVENRRAVAFGASTQQRSDKAMNSVFPVYMSIARRTAQSSEQKTFENKTHPTYPAPRANPTPFQT